MIHRSLAKSLDSGDSRNKVFDHCDVPKTIAMTGVLFVDANHAPPCKTLGYQKGLARWACGIWATSINWPPPPYSN